jgi:hypothetical protein
VAEAQLYEMVRVLRVGQPGEQGVPAGGGRADEGVVQRGAAAQDREPGVGVGGLEATAVVEVEVELVVREAPTTRNARRMGWSLGTPVAAYPPPSRDHRTPRVTFPELAVP